MLAAALLSGAPLRADAPEAGEIERLTLGSRQFADWEAAGKRLDAMGNRHCLACAWRATAAMPKFG
jgi:hypothetical protein